MGEVCPPVVLPMAIATLFCCSHREKDEADDEGPSCFCSRRIEKAPCRPDTSCEDAMSHASESTSTTWMTWVNKAPSTSALQDTNQKAAPPEKLLASGDATPQKIKTLRTGRFQPANGGTQPLPGVVV